MYPYVPIYSRNALNDYKSNVGVRGNASVCSFLVVLCETDKIVRKTTYFKCIALDSLDSAPNQLPEIP